MYHIRNNYDRLTSTDGCYIVTIGSSLDPFHETCITYRALHPYMGKLSPQDVATVLNFARSRRSEVHTGLGTREF